MDVTKWIALYGAILGTTNLAWVIYSGNLDRRKLKLIIRDVHQVYIGDAVSLTVTNTGRRPIKVVDIGLGLSQTGYYRPIDVNKDKLPTFLHEGESVEYFFPKNEIRTKSVLLLWVRDAANRIYTLNGNMIWDIIPESKPNFSEAVSKRKYLIYLKNVFNKYT